MKGIHAAEAYDAIRNSCGRLTDRQIVAVLVEAGLWPEHYIKNLEVGRARVRACLSQRKKDTFSPGDMLAIQRHTGRTDWLVYECRMLGMRPPQTLPREDILTELQNDLRQAREDFLATITTISDQLERLDAPQRPTNGGPPLEMVRFSR